MLITRCPSCHASFKIVPDQLRLGKGWVKCGKCFLAFHAAKHFVHTPSEQSSESAVPAAQSMPASARPPAPVPTATPTRPASQEARSAHTAKEKDAYDDERLSPQTLFPADAVDAMDELVALGAMRPAGNAGASDSTLEAEAHASKPGFMESYSAKTSSFPAQTEQGIASSAVNTADDTGSAEVSAELTLSALLARGRAPAEIQARLESPDTGSLEAWRKSKAARKLHRKTVIHAGNPKDMRRSAIAARAEKSIEEDAVALTTKTPWHPEEAAAEQEEPSFVAKARSLERWQSTPMRLLLISLLGLGTLGAVAQTMYLNRHAIAATQPSALPLLEGLCSTAKETLGMPCNVEPLKRIDAIRVDSHSLAPDTAADTSAGSAAYVLTVMLKNQLELANAWPALDLTFTDTTGAVQARRVLQPKDYLQAAEADTRVAQGLKARDEQRISVRFIAPSLRVGGYEIAAFYP